MDSLLLRDNQPEMKGVQRERAHLENNEERIARWNIEKKEENEREKLELIRELQRTMPSVRTNWIKAVELADIFLNDPTIHFEGHEMAMNIRREPYGKTVAYTNLKNLSYPIGYILSDFSEEKALIIINLAKQIFIETSLLKKIPGHFQVLVSYLCDLATKDPRYDFSDFMTRIFPAIMAKNPRGVDEFNTYLLDDWVRPRATEATGRQ